MQTSLTSGMKQVLSYKQVTIPLLAQHLPKFDKGLHGKCHLVYAIIGHHDDGRYALYIESAGSAGSRHNAHMSCLKAVQRGDKKKKVQFVHEVLGQPGWHVGHHVICTMERTSTTVYRFWMEIIMII